MVVKERKNITKKKQQVKELSDYLMQNKYVTIITLRNLPDSILQSIKKKLRGKALFKVYKWAVVKRAFETVKKPYKLLELCQTEPIAVVLSNEMSPYMISKYFMDNKVNVYAKPGQTATADIIVPKMETNIPPGPALSELKLAGLKASVQKGKIAIIAETIIAKQGTKITGTVAKSLQKLDIKPFNVKIMALAGIDDENIVFSKHLLALDSSVFTGGITNALSQAVSVAYNSGMPISMTAEMLITKAYSQALALTLNQSIVSHAFIENIIAHCYAQGVSVKKYANI
jgi:large subunit ribosomal protein L10